MGLWSDSLLPRVLGKFMKGGDCEPERSPALEGARGRVLELGFGSGLNLPHYPDGVTELLALEPAQVNRKLAKERVEQAPFPVEWVGLEGESVPLDDASVDTVVSTWTLCTIPNLQAALSEAKRVLRPDGELLFLEHGHSPDAKVARWQRRLEPLQKFCFGGCHLTRRHDEELTQAGFEIQKLETYYMKGPKPMSWMYRGRACSSPS